MWRFLLAMLVITFCGNLMLGFDRPVSPEPNGATISLRLVQPQTKFGNKESIPLRVEVSNDGVQTLLVCREINFTGKFCSWDFDIRDASGRSVPRWRTAGDRVVGNPDPFPNALIANWIALAPHYSYGTTIDLVDVLGPNSKPGRYKLKASLTSYGPDSASVYNDLLHYPKELSELPYSGWKGTAETNSISIDIVTSK